MSKIQSGATVSIHYRGTFTDGEQFDSSFDRGDPITFVVGQGQMIPGFEEGVLGMKTGEKKDISLTAKEAYGPRVDEAVQEIPKAQFPPGFVFEPGQVVQGSGGNGHPVMGTILKESSDNVVIDFNHPMAGKDLNFYVEVVSFENGE